MPNTPLKITSAELLSTGILNDYLKFQKSNASNINDKNWESFKNYIANGIIATSNFLNTNQFSQTPIKKYLKNLENDFKKLLKIKTHRHLIEPIQRLSEIESKVGFYYLQLFLTFPRKEYLTDLFFLKLDNLFVGLKHDKKIEIISDLWIIFKNPPNEFSDWKSRHPNYWDKASENTHKRLYRISTYFHNGIIAKHQFLEYGFNAEVIFNRFIEKGWLKKISPTEGMLKQDVKKIGSELKRLFPTDFHRIITILQQSQNLFQSDKFKEYERIRMAMISKQTLELKSKNRKIKPILKTKNAKTKYIRSQYLESHIENEIQKQWERCDGLNLAELHGILTSLKLPNNAETITLLEQDTEFINAFRSPHAPKPYNLQTFSIPFLIL